MIQRACYKNPSKAACLCCMHYKDQCPLPLGVFLIFWGLRAAVSVVVGSSLLKFVYLLRHKLWVYFPFVYTLRCEMWCSSVSPKFIGGSSKIYSCNFMRKFWRVRLFFLCLYYEVRDAMLFYFAQVYRGWFRDLLLLARDFTHRFWRAIIYHIWLSWVFVVFRPSFWCL